MKTGLLKPLAKVGRSLAKVKPIAKAMTAASRNKPEIMAVSGGICVVVAFAWAIKEATHVKDTMIETAEKVEKVEAEQQERRNNTEEKNEEKLAKMEKKELAKARAEGVWEVTKPFILPTGLLVIGMVLIGGGHHILRKRNVVLASALKGTEEMFKFYRGNVVAAEGEEADLKYMRGVIDGKEVETTVVDENGKETKAKHRVPIVKDSKRNPWRFEFSDTYFNSYEDDTDRNLFFLKCSEDWWNHELERHEEVSMYEILKYLGYKFEVLKASCKDMAEYRERMTFLRNYGWRKGCGDGFIDFGLYRAINEAAIARKTDVVFIEFNASGNLENLTVKDYTK